MVLVFKIAWGTLRKRSKSMVFAREIMFPKCIIYKKKPPAAGYTPSNVQFVLRASTAHSIIFSNLQAAIALSTHAQNVFYKLVGALRLGYIIFTGGYRALYTCTKRVYKV